MRQVHLRPAHERFRHMVPYTFGPANLVLQSGEIGAGSVNNSLHSNANPMPLAIAMNISEHRSIGTYKGQQVLVRRFTASHKSTMDRKAIVMLKKVSDGFYRSVTELC